MNDELKRVFEGRSWLCASEVLLSAVGTARAVQDLGGRVMAVGATRGTGDIPDGMPTVDLAMPPASSMMAGIRAGEAALQDLPAAARAQVDAWDPGGTARVLLNFLGTAQEVAGREVFGPRHPEWVALEDKSTVDATWDAAGVVRTPSRIAPPQLDALLAAHRELDVGAGTVWVADNKTGWHGGAEYLRWVREPHDAPAAVADLAPVSHRIRVMPFLEGLPCSIHGIVFPDHVVALRPCEMLVLRRPGQARLHYARAATFWDPPTADREQMRSAVRRVGSWLRHTVGYRGAFTIDGIMTARGFRPTELNARYGAALGVMVQGMPDMPLTLLNTCLMAGEPLGLDPVALEAELLRWADANRRGGGMAGLSRPVGEPVKLGLVLADEGWRRVDEGVPADVDVVIGPGPTGGLVRLGLVPERTPVGPSAAGRVASALRFLDRELALGIGPLEAARDVRG